VKATVVRQTLVAHAKHWDLLSALASVSWVRHERREPRPALGTTLCLKIARCWPPEDERQYRAADQYDASRIRNSGMGGEHDA
jgi:hypothetical protein